MKEKPNTLNNQNREALLFDEYDPYLSGSVSSDTECTGLMPTPPASDAELESYKGLYPFSPAQAVEKNIKRTIDKKTPIDS